MSDDEIIKTAELCCEYSPQEVLDRLEKQIKSEAIKEFADRVKKEISQGTYMVGIFDDIDNLVKEMVGEPSKVEHDSLCETETYKSY